MSIKHKRFEMIDGEVIFVDESGNPDLSPKSKSLYSYYSIGFVYCKKSISVEDRSEEDIKKIT